MLIVVRRQDYFEIQNLLEILLNLYKKNCFLRFVKNLLIW